MFFHVNERNKPNFCFRFAVLFSRRTWFGLEITTQGKVFRYLITHIDKKSIWQTNRRWISCWFRFLLIAHVLFMKTFVDNYSLGDFNSMIIDCRGSLLILIICWYESANKLQSQIGDNRYTRSTPPGKPVTKEAVAATAVVPGFSLFVCVYFIL